MVNNVIDLFPESAEARWERQEPDIRGALTQVLGSEAAAEQICSDLKPRYLAIFAVNLNISISISVPDQAEAYVRDAIKQYESAYESAFRTFGRTLYEHVLQQLLDLEVRLYVAGVLDDDQKADANPTNVSARVFRIIDGGKDDGAAS